MKNTFFNSFFDNTIEGIIIIEDGFIININNSMLEILNYSNKNDILGKLATGILIPKINQKYLEYNQEVYEEIEIITKNGKIIPAIIKIKDVEEDNKNYKMVFILNLSELKEKESLMIEQSRMAAMGEMIAMIAHQWRQPLSSVGAAISNLKFRLNIGKYEKDLFEEKLNDIDTYLKYMSGTVDDFRNFFRTDKKKELVSLDEIVDLALEMLEKPFLNKNIEIINNQIELKKIRMYKNEFLQVIINILNNAKDAFDEHKDIKNARILIEYDNCDNYQTLKISDNAGGIPKDIIEKIYDPYFSTKENKNGTGLGLYMTKMIIEKHCDGEILVSSKNDTTSFEIKLSTYSY